MTIDSAIIYALNHHDEIIFFDGDYYSVNPVITHATRFHSDDVFASALIYLLYVIEHPELSEEGCRANIKFVRKNNQLESIYSDTEWFKNGIQPLIYDVGDTKYDHHKFPREARSENGIAYSAFGKLWRAMYRHFGVDKIHYQLFDRDFVQPICKADCYGYKDLISTAIQTFNPVEDIDTTLDFDVKFDEAVFTVAVPILRSALNDLNRRMTWFHRTMSATSYPIMHCPIIEFTKPVNGNWVSDYSNAKAVLYPQRRGGYAVKALSTYDENGNPCRRWEADRHLYDNTLTDEEKQLMGITFAHPNGFLFIFETREHALAFAQKYITE